MTAAEFSDLESWMAARLLRLRDDLDARERNRAVDRQKARERQLGEQFEFRGRLQWYVHVSGTGHGSREGTRAMPEAPVVYRGVEKG